MQNFRTIVERHPAWGASRLMLAHSLGHVAGKPRPVGLPRRSGSGNRRQHAISLEENAWVLCVRLFVNLKVIQLRQRHDLPPETWEDALNDAKEVAKLLRQEYPDNTLANWVMAGFYDTIGDKESAEDIWRRLLRSGDFGYCSTGWLYGNDTSGRTLDIVQRLHSRHPMIRAAEAHVMADIPEKRAEALRIYHELTPQASSAFLRSIVIQIPLLLGETDWQRDNRRSG